MFISYIDFNQVPPTRDCCSVHDLPLGAKVSMSAIAMPRKRLEKMRKYIGNTYSKLRSSVTRDELKKM